MERLQLRIDIGLEHLPEFAELIVERRDDGDIRMTILARGDEAFETIATIDRKQARVLATMLVALSDVDC